MQSIKLGLAAINFEIGFLSGFFVEVARLSRRYHWPIALISFLSPCTASDSAKIRGNKIPNTQL